MTDYSQVILQHQAESNRLQAANRLAFDKRKKSQHALRDWERTASELRNHLSNANELIERCLVADLNTDQQLREFMFTYIRVDPFFHRSGYVLEKMLRRAKSLELSKPERAIVKAAILSRLKTRGGREFRELCRLIPRVVDDEFRNRLMGIAELEEPGIRHRANFAKSYLPPANRPCG
ncbi:MAG: hypothetical protein AAF742_05965 [Pseudomonadota bacterium]